MPQAKIGVMGGTGLYDVDNIIPFAEPFCPVLSRIVFEAAFKEDGQGRNIKLYFCRRKGVDEPHPLANLA